MQGWAGADKLQIWDYDTTGVTVPWHGMAWLLHLQVWQVSNTLAHGLACPCFEKLEVERMLARSWCLSPNRNCSSNRIIQPLIQLHNQSLTQLLTTSVLYALCRMCWGGRMRLSKGCARTWQLCRLNSQPSIKRCKLRP